jgi:exopolysaccharide biosynthesis polyprenyl glycosylphosphotransferase
MIPHSRFSARQSVFRLLDPLILCGSMLIANYLRWDQLPPDEFHWLVLLLLLPVAAGVFALVGAYDGMRSLRLLDWCRRPLWGLLIVLVTFLVIAYAAKLSGNFSRSVVVGWLAFSAGTMVTLRVVVHRILLDRHRRGIGVERIVLIGERDLCLAWVERLNERPQLGMHVEGMVVGAETIVDEHEPTRQRIAVMPRKLTLAEVRDEAEAGRVDRVIVCGHLSDEKLVAGVLKALLPTAVAVQYAPDYLMAPLFIFRAGECAGRPLIDLSASPLDDGARAIKWVEDKVLAVLILILISPLLLFSALAVKLSSRGPMLFIQDRHGLNGRVIRVFKFRTMYHGELPPHRAALAAAKELETRVDDGESSHWYKGQKFHQAVHDDPRITPVGKFLRGTSLDELPQFINVLLGDMSIVGPRPHPIALNLNFVDDIAELMRRHYVKPGITGLAQISGARGETKALEDMRRRVEYDLEYIRNWSLWLDLKIVALTAVRGWINRQP